MKKRRTILCCVLIAVLAFTCFAGCRKSKPAPTVDGAASSLRFSPNTLSVAVDASAPTALTGLTANEQVTQYSSNRPSVASVDENGRVSGLTVGEAVVKATTNKGNTALLAVTVYDAQGEGLPVIKVAKEDVRLQVGDEYALDAKLMRGNTIENGIIIWQTSNASVATVNDGKIRAISAGSARLTASATLSGLRAVTTVSVTVSDKGFVVCPDYENKAIYKGNIFPLGISATDGGEKVTLSDVQYSSSNLDIAYLTTGNGVTTLEALKGGSVTITAAFRYKSVDYSIRSELYIYGTHTVSVYALGYTTNSRDQRITGNMYGDIITLSLNNKVAGREIKCWYVNGKKIEGNTFIMPDEDVTAYAKYVNETEGDFTSSFTSGTMFGQNQATTTFHQGVIKDGSGAENTDTNYVELGAVGVDGGALTFNFDESVVVSDSASAILRIYCAQSASLYLGIGATKRSLYARNATASSEALNKKVDIQTDRWIEITVPLNDFVANENVLGNFSVGVLGGKIYIDYIMLKY